MHLLFDHVVHFIKKHPSEAVREMKERGWHAVMGGQHEMWGTYNSLLYAGLSYIEFLAVEDINTAEASDNPLIQLLLHDKEGFGQICLRTDNIQALKENMDQKGFQTGEVIEAQRRRENGDLLQWKMLFIKNDEGLPCPFFIQWGQPDDVRLHDLKEAGILSEEQATRRVLSVHFGVKDMEKTVLNWATLLDKPASDTVEDKETGSRSRSIVLGSTELIFAEPTGPGLVADVIAKKEERPFMVTIGESESTDNIFNGVYRL
jgi:hypothetical protein